MLRTLLRPSTALGASLKTSRVVPLAARALHTRLLVPAHLPLRAVAAHPTFVRFKTTRSAWAQNPIVDYNELKPITEQPSDVSHHLHCSPLGEAVAESQDILLIDVREPDEVALGSVPSSVNLPLSQLPDALGKMNESEFQNVRQRL